MRTETRLPKALRTGKMVRTWDALAPKTFVKNKLAVTWVEVRISALGTGEGQYRFKA